MDVKGPRSRKSYKADGDQAVFNLEHYQHSFDADAFNAMILSAGLYITHHKAIPDPTGMTSRGDTHDVSGNRESSDGFIYKEAGKCLALFTNNNSSQRYETLGVIGNSSAYMTFPQTYEDGITPIIITPWDRFYLNNIEIRVATWQYIEANSNGMDKLQFPATAVEYIIDANKVEYTENVDYQITPEGNIKWISQKRPGWNADINKGIIYSIRYRYTPFFIAYQLTHEIRVAQRTDFLTGNRDTLRMPYQVLVLRENVFRDVNAGDPNKKGFAYDERYSDLPPVGGQMGPQWPKG